jgi:hypothetical protein
MRTLGFVLICHNNLDKVKLLAEYWANKKYPVAIHIDSKASKKDMQSIQKDLSPHPFIKFATPSQCEWGMWSLVAATKSTAAFLLDAFPNVQHVYLASESCLPLRPVEALEKYLSQTPDTDYIESLRVDCVNWSVGGGDIERFKYRYPFSWKKDRYAFEFYKRIQKRLNIQRKPPKELNLHIGSQWWCLTRKTLERILSDQNRSRYVKFFKRVWIPDESYFQTLSRLYSTDIKSVSLTFSKFDSSGRPHIFYDDHEELLKKSRCFMARKIWPQSKKLYSLIAELNTQTADIGEPLLGHIDRHFGYVNANRIYGRHGVYTIGRYPNPIIHMPKTHSPYTVFYGLNRAFVDFELWLSKKTTSTIHGNLFSKDTPPFKDGRCYVGNIPNDIKIRDYNPEQFLMNLIWNSTDAHQTFFLSACDDIRIFDFIKSDSNANIIFVSDSWLLDLFLAENQNSFAFAKNLYDAERKMLKSLRDYKSCAKYTVWNLNDIMEKPNCYLSTELGKVFNLNKSICLEPPKLIDAKRFALFLGDLQNSGIGISGARYLASNLIDR